MSGEAGLTHGEAQLYDRQLRLWGVDAQRRLKSSRVFMFGLSALVGEVAKNLILAGVNRVTLVDDRAVTESDLASSFFVSQSDLGKNVAETFYTNLRVLNSLVTVDWYDWKLEEGAKNLEQLFDRHPKANPPIAENDLVVVSGFNLAAAAEFAKECRSRGAACYVAGCKGALGCFFADLGGTFQFCQSDDAQLTEIQRKFVGTQQTICFPALATVLNLNPSLKRADVVTTDTPAGQRHFSLACSLLNCIAAGDELATIDRNLLDCCGAVNVDMVGNATLTPATASVVGGILAQEIVKAICRNSAPFNNFFFIDVTRFFSLVDCIRSAESEANPRGVLSNASIPVPVSP